MVKTLDVIFRAEGVAGFVTGMQLWANRCGQRVVAIEINIAASANVLGADQFRDVVVMIQYVLNSGRLRIAHEHANSGDTHHSAGRPDLPDGFVSLAARMRIE